MTTNAYSDRAVSSDIKALSRFYPVRARCISGALPVPARCKRAFARAETGLTEARRAGLAGLKVPC